MDGPGPNHGTQSDDEVAKSTPRPIALYPPAARAQAQAPAPPPAVAPPPTEAAANLLLSMLAASRPADPPRAMMSGPAQAPPTHHTQPINYGMSNVGESNSMPSSTSMGHHAAAVLLTAASQRAQEGTALLQQGQQMGVMPQRTNSGAKVPRDRPLIKSEVKGKGRTPKSGDDSSKKGGDNTDDGSAAEGAAAAAYVTRCICGLSHNDDFMISCDKCEVWQHVECFEDMDKNVLPEKYICEQCLPRPFNAARARRIQLQKLPTLIKDDHGASVASSDDEDRGSNDDFSKNVFEEGLLDLLEQVSPEARDVVPADSVKIYLKQLPGKRRQGVFTIEPLEAGHFVGSFCGRFRRASDCPEVHSIHRRKQPYVWQHPTADLCVDARHTFTDLRYIRRSCCPNAEIASIRFGDDLGLGVFLTEDVPINTELALDYDYDHLGASYKPDNTCRKEECRDIQNLAYRARRASMKAAKAAAAATAAPPTPSVPGGATTRHAATSSPAPEQSEANLPEHPEKSESPSADDIDPSDEAPSSRKRGSLTGQAMSREDRKILAIMKQFERISKTKSDGTASPAAQLPHTPRSMPARTMSDDGGPAAPQPSVEPTPRSRRPSLSQSGSSSPKVGGGSRAGKAKSSGKARAAAAAIKRESSDPPTEVASARPEKKSKTVRVPKSEVRPSIRASATPIAEHWVACVQSIQTFFNADDLALHKRWEGIPRGGQAWLKPTKDRLLQRWKKEKLAAERDRLGVEREKEAATVAAARRKAPVANGAAKSAPRSGRTPRRPSSVDRPASGRSSPSSPSAPRPPPPTSRLDPTRRAFGNPPRPPPAPPPAVIAAARFPPALPPQAPPPFGYMGNGAAPPPPPPPNRGALIAPPAPGVGIPAASSPPGETPPLSVPSAMPSVPTSPVAATKRKAVDQAPLDKPEEKPKKKKKISMQDYLKRLSKPKAVKEETASATGDVPPKVPAPPEASQSASPAARESSVDAKVIVGDDAREATSESASTPMDLADRFGVPPKAPAPAAATAYPPPPAPPPGGLNSARLERWQDAVNSLNPDAPEGGASSSLPSWAHANHSDGAPAPPNAPP